MASRPRKPRAEASTQDTGSETRHPREALRLVGHDKTVGILARLVDRGRLPHGVLLTGEPGVGKATLSYALARRLLARDDEVTTGTLAIASAGSTTAQVGAGSHPGLYVVEAERDPRTNRLKPITVEAIREMTGFLHHTAASGGWRVVIVDGAEQMNNNAANALLKLLEEPPERSALLLVCSVVARMPRTIASRCVRFHLAPLSSEAVREALGAQPAEFQAAALDAAVAQAGGSVGRAIELMTQEHADLSAAVARLLNDLPRLDVTALHELAEKVGRAGADASYDLVMDQILAWVASTAKASVRGEGGGGGLPHPSPLDAWASLWEKINTARRQADGANLDRRQVVLQTVLDLRRGVSG